MTKCVVIVRDQFANQYSDEALIHLDGYREIYDIKFDFEKDMDKYSK